MTSSLCGRTGQLHSYGLPVFEGTQEHHIVVFRC
jgi:hypothetical protein